ncbi:SPOSA6832_04876 [Sporobolomyces salmonicolor]|uniref:SPOSA6832_04876-mRNA-1:cds n=1 Tax=Sporidiobolus salmonicolor TaxID=5005 RepID=A0A0D6ESA5_SPOSA|nr:SPOSA6832_04876 [Sporobolomyces salmonicolor]
MPLPSQYTLSTGATLASVGLGRVSSLLFDPNAPGIFLTTLDLCWMGTPVKAGASGNEETYEMVRTALGATDPSTGETIPFDQSPTFVQTWLEMEKLLSTGKVKCIGVSNFSIKNLEILLPQATVPHISNPQVEGHPYLPNDALAAYCKEKGIHLTAYCPLGQGRSPILLEPLLAALSRKYAKPAGSILLSWGVQRGWSVVPKSSNPGRMAQNLDIFELEEADMDAISALHRQPGNYRSLCDYGPGSQKDGYCSGWRIKEDLGWDYPITKAEGGGWTA